MKTQYVRKKVEVTEDITLQKHFDQPKRGGDSGGRKTTEEKDEPVNFRKKEEETSTFYVDRTKS